VRRPQHSDTYLLDRAGEILLGRYRIVELIGVGGMGSIWEAEQLALKRPVVVKFHETWSKSADHEQAIGRFVQEAELLAAVHHRNVAELFEVGRTDDGEPFLIMERLYGHALSHRMRDGRPMPLSEALPIAIDIAAGLEAVHAAGVHHRDIKPENIFLHRDEEMDELVPKLLDFGLAGFASSDETDAENTVGTPGYMPPEQAYGLRHIDHRADIYALGVTLYEMLAAALPHDGETNQELIDAVVSVDARPLKAHRGDLPDAVTEAIMRTLDRDKQRRPRDARELRRELRALLEHV